MDYYTVMSAPCVEACPAHVDVPRYIDYIKAGEPEMSFCGSTSPLSVGWQLWPSLCPLL